MYFPPGSTDVWSSCPKSSAEGFPATAKRIQVNTPAVSLQTIYPPHLGPLFLRDKGFRDDLRNILFLYYKILLTICYFINFIIDWVQVIQKYSTLIISPVELISKKGLFDYLSIFYPKLLRYYRVIHKR